MKRELQFSTDARNSLKRGIDLGARMVGISYGPAGRNILMDNAKGKPSLSRNGNHLLSNVSRKNRGKDQEHTISTIKTGIKI
jgi:chaperonin GroEL